MADGKLRNVLHHVGRLVGPRQAQDLPDQELLGRFVQSGEEAAFAALMERHGPMVLGVCGRVLQNAHDAEDACQAVFLVLARRANAVKKRGSLASWLHGVAWRVARKLRSTLARRNARESVAVAEKPTASAPADISWRELLQILDEELNRLPQVYKAPLVLCHLQGRTQDEAVRELGWTIWVLRGRLQRGREKLRARLLRRGITASAALGAVTLAPSLCSAAVPSSLVVSTLNASLAVATSKAFPATLSPRVVALTQKALRAELLIPIKMAVTLGFAAAAVSAAALSFGLLANLQAPVPAASRSVEAWPEAIRLEGHPAAHAWCVDFSPDGKLLASGAGRILPDEGEHKMWDVATGQVLFSIKTPEAVRGVVFAPDGKTLATAEHDDIARLRDVKTGKVLVALEGHRSGIA